VIDNAVKENEIEMLKSTWRGVVLCCAVLCFTWLGHGPWESSVSRISQSYSAWRTTTTMNEQRFRLNPMLY